jgi:hypothetical protein
MSMFVICTYFVALVEADFRVLIFGWRLEPSVLRLISAGNKP